MAKKTGGIPIDLVPNMYELGLFKRALASRGRLRATTAVYVAGLTLAFGGAGYFIRAISEWALANGVLIVALYLGALAGGYLLALTIGDIFFAGPWRMKMAMGAKFIPDDLEEQKALLKNKNIYFIFIWVAAFIGLIFGCDLVTGGNILWYQSVGGAVVSMRSSDAHERAMVLKTLSNPFHDKRWSNQEVRDNVEKLVLDPDPEVRAWAAYFAGRAKIVEATDNLMTLLRDENADAHSRAEAAVALARMEWKPARPLLLSTMRSAFAASHADTELVPSALYGFFALKDSMASQETIRILDTCLTTRDCSREIVQYAFFYLKSMHVQDEAALSFRYLETADITDEMRCYATDALRFTASKKDVPRLKHEYEIASSQQECPVVYRKYHEEPAIILFEADPLRSLQVRAIGNLSMDDGADFDWIWMVGDNQNENPSTRKVAEMYTRAMQEKGVVK